MVASSTTSAHAKLDLHLHSSPLLSPQKLPVEILFMIFKYVALETKSSNIHPVYGWEDKDECTRENLLSSAHFPISFASVCTTWWDIVSSVPDWWEEVIITIGVQPVPMSIIQSCFNWSQDHPIDVTVIVESQSHSTMMESGVSLEKFTMGAVVEALVPHAHRCRGIRFFVNCSSSLPSIPRHFAGTAPLLEELVLDCLTDNGGAPKFLPATVDSEGQWEWSTPSLKRPVLDGRNFRDAFVNHRSHFEVNHFYRLSLNISCYRPSSTDLNRFTLYDVLAAIEGAKHVAFLTIRDVHFDGIFVPRQGLLFRIGHVDSIWLEDLAHNAVPSSMLHPVSQTMLLLHGARLVR